MTNEEVIRLNLETNIGEQAKLSAEALAALQASLETAGAAINDMLAGEQNLPAATQAATAAMGEQTAALEAYQAEILAIAGSVAQAKAAVETRIASGHQAADARELGEFLQREVQALNEEQQALRQSKDALDASGRAYQVLDSRIGEYIQVKTVEQEVVERGRRTVQQASDEAVRKAVELTQSQKALGQVLSETTAAHEKGSIWTRDLKSLMSDATTQTNLAVASAKGLGQTMGHSGEMGRGVLQASYAFQDFTSVMTGGGGFTRALSSIQNNIPVLLVGLGMGGGLAGAISLIGVTAGLVGPPIVDFFGKMVGGADEAKDRITVLKDRIKELEGKHKIALEYEELDQAQDKLERLNAAMAAYKAGVKTLEEDDAGKAAGKAVKSMGSRNVERAIVQDWQVRGVTPGFSGENEVKLKEKISQRASLARTIEEEMAKEAPNAMGIRSARSGLAILDQEIAGLEHAREQGSHEAAVGLIGGAASGDMGDIQELAGISGRIPGAFGADFRAGIGQAMEAGRPGRHKEVEDAKEAAKKRQRDSEEEDRLDREAQARGKKAGASAQQWIDENEDAENKSSWDAMTAAKRTAAEAKTAAAHQAAQAKQRARANTPEALLRARGEREQQNSIRAMEGAERATNTDLGPEHTLAAARESVNLARAGVNTNAATLAALRMEVLKMRELTGQLTHQQAEFFKLRVLSEARGY